MPGQRDTLETPPSDFVPPFPASGRTKEFRGHYTQHHRASFGSRETYGRYRVQKKHPHLRTLCGVEIVDGVTRLAAMNLILHGVGPTGTEAEPPVKTDDSLRSDPGDRFDLVLTNGRAAWTVDRGPFHEC